MEKEIIAPGDRVLQQEAGALITRFLFVHSKGGHDRYMNTQTAAATKLLKMGAKPVRGLKGKGT